MPDHGCDIVVVGASAGGVEALMRFARAAPADFSAPVLVVLHVPASGPSVLPQILERAGRLGAVHAEDGMELDGAGFYVAPPDRHVLIEGTTHPARSAARARTGTDRRSTRSSGRPPTRSASAPPASSSRAPSTTGPPGSSDQVEAGGPLGAGPCEALYPSMPASAIGYAQPDYVLPIEELVDALVRLTAAPDGRAGKEELRADDQAPDPSAESGAARGARALFRAPTAAGRCGRRSEGEPAVVPVPRRPRVHAQQLGRAARRRARGRSGPPAARWRSAPRCRGGSRVGSTSADAPSRRGRFERQAAVEAGQAERAEAVPRRGRGGARRRMDAEAERGELRLGRMASSTKLDDLERAARLHQGDRAASTSPATSARACTPGRRSGCRRSRSRRRGLPRVPRGAPGRVRRALQHDPDQRHRVLPRRAGVGLPAPEIVPRIVEDAERATAIRIWSTGCASGEEAYTLAICFAEASERRRSASG